MSQPLIDHRGPTFAALLREVLQGLKALFRTADGHVLLFPGSGTCGWECCIVNTLSPGDQVLFFIADFGDPSDVVQDEIGGPFHGIPQFCKQAGPDRGTPVDQGNINIKLP